MENDNNRPYINFGDLKRKESLLDKILPNKQTFNKIILGLGVAIAVYGTKVHHETNKLSQSLTPLRNEYSRLVYSNRNDPIPDYNKRTMAIQNARQQFAEDNGATDRPWRINMRYSDFEKVNIQMPSPIAYDFRQWFKSPDNSAIKEYFENK